MDGPTGIGVFGSDSFKGYDCAFCGVTIAPSDTTPLPLSILAGGRTFRLWMHRACLAERVQPLTRRMLEKIPAASPDELNATRLRLA